MQDQVKALNIIHEFLPLRLTVQPSDRLQQLLPSSTHYYGIVSSAEYQSIVAGAKVFNFYLRAARLPGNNDPCIAYRRGMGYCGVRHVYSYIKYIYL